MSSNSPRPLSPHLQVYKLPLTALLSISTRITGVINSFAAMLLVFTLAMAASGEEAFRGAQALLGSWFGILVLFGFTLSVYFHLCNGIRHLFWDMGKGFDIEVADKTGKITLVAAGLLTVLTWIVAFAAS